MLSLFQEGTASDAPLSNVEIRWTGMSQNVRRALYPHGATNPGPTDLGRAPRPFTVTRRMPIPVGDGNGQPSGLTNGQIISRSVSPAFGLVPVDYHRSQAERAIVEGDIQSPLLAAGAGGVSGVIQERMGMAPNRLAHVSFQQAGRMPPTMAQDDDDEGPDFNPTGHFIRPESRFSLQKAIVLDWTRPPGGTFTVADVYFKVYSANIGILDRWISEKLSSDLINAAQTHGRKALGYILWKDRDGIISHEYVLQLALAGASPVDPVTIGLIVAALLAVALIIWLAAPIIKNVRDVFVGESETPDQYLTPGTPAPPGTVVEVVDPETGNVILVPVPAGKPTPPGAYIPGKRPKKGLFDSLEGMGGILAIGVLALVVMGRRQ